MSIPDISVTNVTTAIALTSTTFNIYQNKEYFYNKLLSAGYYLDETLDTEFFKGATFYNLGEIELDQMRTEASNLQANLNDDQPEISRNRRRDRRGGGKGGGKGVGKQIKNFFKHK